LRCFFGGSIGALSFIVSTSQSITFSGNVVIEAVKAFGLGTVKVEPPITDKVVLVENSSVGTEERVLGKASLTISSTNMEDLTFSFRISIITSINLPVTGEAGLGDLGVDGVVLTRHSWDGGLQHGEGVGGVAGRGVQVAVAGLGVGVQRLLLASLPVVVAVRVTSEGVTAHSEGEG